MLSMSGRGAVLTLLLGFAMVLPGCGSKVANWAPVEDRGSATGVIAPPAEAQVQSQKPLVGLENAGQPGYYTVKPGDTLIRIGLDSGQNWKDLARWNGLENPNLIEVGQTLRVVPPAGATAGVAAVAVAKPVTSANVAATAVAPAQAASTPSAASAASAAGGPAPAASQAAGATAPVGPQGPDEELAWVWPARGSVISGFDEVKNKGLDIAGTAGEPVLAAADGRVVYVGASLRGYGNLVILKHNNTYLTAYAHNQVLLVKEDQAVRRGQKIAEMGNSDADRVKLHFEVRRQGKPVDPAKYLPAR